MMRYGCVQLAVLSVWFGVGDVKHRGCDSGSVLRVCDEAMGGCESGKTVAGCYMARYGECELNARGFDVFGRAGDEFLFRS